MGAWLLIIVVAIILTICTDTFFTWDNIMNVVRQTCVVSIIALGSSFVVLGGEIDLSTGMYHTGRLHNRTVTPKPDLLLFQPFWLPF